MNEDKGYFNSLSGAATAVTTALSARTGLTFADPEAF
jgi:hypothetical protein